MKRSSRSNVSKRKRRRRNPLVIVAVVGIVGIVVVYAGAQFSGEVRDVLVVVGVALLAACGVWQREFDSGRRSSRRTR